MKYLVVIAFTIILVAVDSKILPAKDEEQTEQPQQMSQLADRIKEAQTLINNLGTQIQEHLNLPNQDELVNTIREQSTNFANSVQEYFKNMSEKVSNNPELENLWTNFKTKVSEAVDKIAINPETTQQVQQLRAKFQDGVQTLLTESENAAKTIQQNSGKVQEDIANFTKQAIDIAVQASQNLNNQLQQAAQTAPPSA